MQRIAPDQRDFARKLRSASTDTERALWHRLRGQQLHSARFRRQHPLGPYVVDFACVDARVIVEVDGGQHVDSTHDAARDAWLAAHGWRVLRFWNNDVLMKMEDVLGVIAGALGAEPPPQPSPWQGEGVKP